MPMIYDQILIDLFLDLVQIDGLSGNEAGVADYIKNFTRNLGFSCLEDEAARFSGGNSGNLICRVGSGGDTVLTAHMDTARPTKNLKAQVLSDRIVSDGTTILGADNRAGLAVLLYLLRRVAAGNPDNLNFTLAFTICEETSMAGSKNIDLSGIRQGFVFDSSARPGNFIFQAYGAQSFEISVNGRASHSGIAPERGIHAIKIAASALAELPVGRIDEETTMNFGIIRGGSAVNVVPDQVIIEGEIRSSGINRIPELGQRIESTFKQKAQAAGGTSLYTAHWDFMPYRVDPASTVFRRISAAIERVGLEPKPVISKGGSDANSFNAKGIQTVNIGIGAQNPHANDEFIYLDDLHSSAAIAWELIRSDI